MKLLRSLTTVSGFTLASRVAGYFRDRLMASLLGTGIAMDALVVAMKLPSLLRRLLAEGAFNGAFVPMYSGMLANPLFTYRGFLPFFLSITGGFSSILRTSASIASRSSSGSDTSQSAPKEKAQRYNSTRWLTEKVRVRPPSG